VVARAFARVGLEPEPYVRVAESLQRGKAELHDLVGDPSKAERELGWRREVEFDALIDMLVDADVAALQSGLTSAESR
jgi:GDPmannose 4,6-dehydratase